MWYGGIFLMPSSVIGVIFVLFSTFILTLFGMYASQSKRIVDTLCVNAFA